MRSKKLVLTSLSVLMIVFLWVFIFYGFIEINFPTTNSGNISYKIYSRDGTLVTEKKATDSSFKKLLRRGVYRIEVQQDQQSGIEVVNSKGLFSTTQVDMQPEAAKSREFVGQNPALCMVYGNDLLYSHNCGSSGGITAHIPGSGNNPPYTNTENEDVPIPSLGLFSLSGSVYSLIAENETSTLNAYKVDQNIRLKENIGLKNIYSDEAGGVVAYKKGVLLYSNSMDRFAYYATLSSFPQKMTFSPSADRSEPVQVSVSETGFGALYNNSSNVESDDITDSENPSSIKGKSGFIYYTNGNKKYYEFNKLYTSGGLCGDTSLCLISAGVLDIYNISEDKAEYEFSIKNARSAFGSKDSIVIVTDSNVIKLSQASYRGSVVYEYGSYKYCGASSAPNGIVLCIIYGDSSKHALYVDLTKSDTDNIDKKILKLLVDPNIDSVAVYKNSVYLTGNYGAAVFNRSIGGYDYPKDIVRETNSKIDILVNSLGLPKLGYRIYNPYSGF